jgi:kynurenine formamidase
MKSTLSFLMLLGYIVPAGAQQIDLRASTLVDLSHAYDEHTVYWPTSPSRFELKELSRGVVPGGWFYSSYLLTTPEHGGTHLDAPFHFDVKGNTSDRIPLSQLIAPAVVIDVSTQTAADRNYRLTVADVERFERTHGRIAAGSIVLLRTGWSRYWPNAREYLGDDTPGDASKLSFPSFGEDAVRLLIAERKIAALGVDVASTDYGASKDFPVHRLAGAANVPGFENLTNLDRLPATGAVVIALPMKIAGGSGGPLRAVAIVPRSTH